MGDPLAKKTISNNILERLEKCERELRRLQTRNIRIRALDDLTEDLGLQQAGEFRAGNGVEPGEGFTGGRFGYPGFEYDGQNWFLAGVNNDELMVGLDLESGEMVAGGGTVKLKDTGISIEEAYGTSDPSMGVSTENALTTLDSSGNVVARVMSFYRNMIGSQNRSLQLKVKSVDIDHGNISFVVYDVSDNYLVSMILDGHDKELSVDGGISVATKLKMGSVGAICGGQTTIVDDGVFSFTPSSPGGILLLHKPGASGLYGIISYDSARPSTIGLLLGNNVATATGVLTGTTGTDGKFTVSCHTDGKIYLENRRSTSNQINWNILAGSL